MLHSLKLANENRWRVLLWAYAPILLWVALIFYLSTDIGSSEQTSHFIRPILEYLFPNASSTTLDLYHHYVRKAAHFTEYGILALLLSRAFLIAHPRLQWWGAAAIAVVAVVACADELTQSLRSTRTASPYDSLIDIAGGAFAVLLMRLWIKRRGAMPSEPREQALV